jgi:hypothetical protein
MIKKMLFGGKPVAESVPGERIWPQSPEVSLESVVYINVS